MSLENLIFTDVLAQESVDGRSGFNFQAVSSGVSAADLQIARDRLIHVVDSSIPTQDDESFVYHPQDGRFFFAKGEGRGATASGRPGNQLTQIIVASGAQDFEPAVPAQMYGATGWNLAKVPGGRAQPWRTPPALAPEYEAENLMNWVKSSPERMRFLGRILTIFDRRLYTHPKRSEDSGRIALVHPRLEEITRWLAIVELLLNHKDVQGFSFRGFETEPMRSTHDVIGVRPNKLHPGTPGFIVCDLQSLSAPEGQASVGTLCVMSWLQNYEADVALRHIALARRWEREALVPQPDAFWSVGAILESSSGWRAGDEPGNRILGVMAKLAAAGFGADVEEHLPVFEQILANDASALSRVATAAREASQAGSSKTACMLVATMLDRAKDDPHRAKEWLQPFASGSRNPWPREVSGGQRWKEALRDVIDAGIPLRDFGDVFVLAQYLPSDGDNDFWEQKAHEFAEELLRQPRRELGPALQRVAPLRVGPVILDAVREEVNREYRSAAGKQEVTASGGLRVRPLSPVIIERLSRDRSGAATVLAERRITRNPQRVDDFTRHQELLDVASMPVEQRTAALSHIPRNPYRWPVALAGTHPMSDCDLWVEWITQCGAHHTLEDFIDEELQKDINAPANKKRSQRKSLDSWLRVVEALQKAWDADNAKWNSRHAELQKMRKDASIISGSLKSIRSPHLGGHEEFDDEGRQL